MVVVKTTNRRFGVFRGMSFGRLGALEGFIYNLRNCNQASLSRDRAFSGTRCHITTSSLSPNFQIPPSSHSHYRLFFAPTSFTRLCSFRLFLLSSQTLHPLSAKSSSTTKSLHLPILPTQLSNPTSTHPSLRAHSVAPNQATAQTAPAIHPTETCVGV